MEDVGGGEGHDPQTDDQAADGEHPAADVTVVRSKTRGLAGCKDLTADTDGDEESAEKKGEPSHG